MTSQKLIDWPYVIGLLLLPVVLVAVLLLAGKLQRIGRYDPAYFSPEYRDRYNTPGAVLTDVETALLHGDEQLIAAGHFAHHDHCGDGHFGGAGEKSAHAHQDKTGRIMNRAGKKLIGHLSESAAEHSADEQRWSKHAAAAAGADGERRGENFQKNSYKHKLYGQLSVDGMLHITVTGRHNLRRKQA